MRTLAQTIANLRQRERLMGENVARRMDRLAALNSPPGALALPAGTRGASAAAAAAPPARMLRGFTILRTSVIEMGVSNSVAVCATIYANRFPPCTSLAPPVARPPSLSPFLFRAAASERSEKEERERRRRGRRNGGFGERRLDLDRLPAK